MRNDTKRFTLLSDLGLYMEVRYYSNDSTQYVLLLAPDDTHDLLTRVAQNLGRYYPLQLWTPDNLKQHARETAAIRPNADALDAMQRDGFQATIGVAKPIEAIYFR